MTSTPEEDEDVIEDAAAPEAPAPETDVPEPEGDSAPGTGPE